ncbi:MAG: IclR family transcriptional regulator [Pyrinomonadaceae bacterium]|jgi:DNA-binding IclR family transcriptional regulator|nr:IclR family transcriptional regulator [Pyrinomonadaceae bacterium]
MDNKASPYRVQVLERSLGILKLLCSDGPELSLIELSERLTLHKSTTHRLLGVLEQHRFVEKSASSGRYRLGLKLFELGSKAIAQFDWGERARGYLQRLAFETGETAHLCILDDGEVLYLEKVEAPSTVRVPSIVGRRYPAHCGGAGKTLLAFQPEEEIEELIKRRGLKSYTRNTLTTPAQLREGLRLVREQGYAIDNEEFEEGLECIGAPIRDYSGKVVAAISIAGPAFRITEEKLPMLARSVMEVAKDLSADLGHHESKEPTAVIDEAQVPA